MGSHTDQAWLALNGTPTSTPFPRLSTNLRGSQHNGGQVTKLNPTALCGHTLGGHYDPGNPETPYSPEVRAGSRCDTSLQPCRDRLTSTLFGTVRTTSECSPSPQGVPSKPTVTTGDSWADLFSSAPFLHL